MSESTQRHDINTALASVQRSIRDSVIAAARPEGCVQLLAVSKRKPLAAIETAWKAGQRSFGENYVDEALEKITSWRSEHPDKNAEWHFIGAIQSRKASSIAAHFDWVHSVDRLKIAQKLSQHRSGSTTPLSVCVQVNLDNESSKSGILASDVADLAKQIALLPNLKLRGLMSIPAPRTALNEQRSIFRALAQLQESLKSDHPTLDTLSMGMSADLDAAILEGSTIVRVGTAIFGARGG